MADIILMDNFSTIAAQGQRIDASPWTRKRYEVFGTGLLAEAGIVDNQWALTIPSSVGRPVRPSNALVTRLPNEFTRFCTGFQVRSYVAVPNPIEGSGSFAVGSIEGDKFRPVLIMTMVNTVLRVYYVDPEGELKTINLTIPGTNKQFYLDYTFDKVSNVAGQMSSFTLALDNVTILSGDYFNNAGTNLGIMHIGNISLVPNVQGGFINELNAEGNPTSAYAYTYGIGHLWVTRNGRRYGKAVVSRTQASGTLGMPANVGDPLDVINQTVPNIDRNVYGKKLVAAFTEHADAAASQLTTLVQHNLPTQEADAELDFGTDTTQFKVTNELELVRVGFDGAPNRAEMRIET